MSHEAKIHQTQTLILRELLFLPSAKFSNLQKKSNLDSDHFKFHIAKLVESGYVAKLKNGEYALTEKGKEYANKLDTDKNAIERQPKTSVILVIQDGDKVLLQQRKKHPYFDFWGYPGGKIRWGETILEAGARELFEEAGLRADLEYRGVYHEHTKIEGTEKVVEDKIFHVLFGSNIQGQLLEKFDSGENAWVELSTLDSIDKKYSSTDIETDVGLGKISFVEKVQTYREDEF